MTECFAQRIEHVNGKVIEVLDLLPGRIVWYAVDAGGYGVKELWKGEVFRGMHSSEGV